MTQVTQLRGRALEEHVETVIRNRAAEAHESGEMYVYNATEIAQRAGTTRKTLRRHERAISSVLAALKLERRTATGDVRNGRLCERIVRLQRVIAEQEKQISALRESHVEIFQRLYEQADAELLIRPILRRLSDADERCLLCRQKVDNVSVVTRQV
jgi:predicted transcriptional regulator